MISNEQFLSIVLFALYLLLAWEIFEHFSAQLEKCSSTAGDVVPTTKDRASDLPPITGGAENISITS